MQKVLTKILKKRSVSSQLQPLEWVTASDERRKWPQLTALDGKWPLLPKYLTTRTLALQRTQLKAEPISAKRLNHSQISKLSLLANCCEEQSLKSAHTDEFSRIGLILSRSTEYCLEAARKTTSSWILLPPSPDPSIPKQPAASKFDSRWITCLRQPLPETFRRPGSTGGS